MTHKSPGEDNNLIEFNPPARGAPATCAARGRTVLRALSRPGGRSRLDDRRADLAGRLPRPLGGSASGNRHLLDRPITDCRSGDRLLDGMAMDARTMIAALWLLVGLAGGVAHFALLRRNTMLFLSSCQASCLSSASSLAHAIALQVLRLAAVVALLGFAAWHGALPLLLAALGVMLARHLVLRRMQVAP